MAGGRFYEACFFFVLIAFCLTFLKEITLSVILVCLGIWFARLPYCGYILLFGLIPLILIKRDRNTFSLILFLGLLIPFMFSINRFHSLSIKDIILSILAPIGSLGYLSLLRTLIPFKARKVIILTASGVLSGLILGFVVSFFFPSYSLERLNPFDKNSLDVLKQELEKGNTMFLEDRYNTSTKRDISYASKIGLLLSDYYAKRKDYKRAEEWLVKSHINDPKREANLLWLSGRKAEALRKCKGLIFQPDDLGELKLLGNYYLHHSDYINLSNLIKGLSKGLSDEPFAYYLKGRLAYERREPSLSYFKKAFPYVPEAGYYKSIEEPDTAISREDLRLTHSMLPYNALIYNRLYNKSLIDGITSMPSKRIEIDEGFTLLGISGLQNDIVPYESIRLTCYIYLDRDQFEHPKPFIQLGKEIEFLKDLRFASMNVDTLPLSIGSIWAIEILAGLDESIKQGDYKVYFSFGYDDKNLLRFKQGLGKAFQIRVSDIKVKRDDERSMKALIEGCRWRKLQGFVKEYALKYPPLSKEAEACLGSLEIEIGDREDALRHFSSVDTCWSFLMKDINRVFKNEYILPEGSQVRLIPFPNNTRLLGYKIDNIEQNNAELSLYMQILYPLAEDYLLIKVYDKDGVSVGNANHYIIYAPDQVKQGDVITTHKKFYFREGCKDYRMTLGFWDHNPFDDPIILNPKGEREVLLGGFRAP